MDDNELLNNLLQAARQGEEAIRLYLQLFHPASVELSQALESWAVRATSERLFQMAYLAQMAAAESWSLSQDDESAWSARCSAAGSMLMAATKASEYQVTRAFVARTLERFEKISRDDLLFQSVIVTAECFFWESQLSEAPEKLRLVQQGAKELGRLPLKTWPDQFQRQLGSLLEGISITLWRSITLRERDTTDDLLGRLANIAEHCISPAIDFQGEGARTKQVRTVLATLLSMHGSRAEGSARWKILLDGPHSAKSYEEWLAHNFGSYKAIRGSRDRYVNYQAAALRAYLRGTLEWYRASLTSVAGRHWAAAVSDSISGELLWDDLRGSLSTNAEYFEAIEWSIGRMLLDELQGLYRKLPSDVEEQTMHLREERLLYSRKLRESTLYEAEDRKLSSQIRSKAAPTILMGGPGTEFTEAIAGIEKEYALSKAGFIGSSISATSAQLASALSEDELLLYFFVVAAERHPAKELLVAAISRTERIFLPITLENMPGWRDSGSSGFGIVAPDGAPSSEGQFEWNDASPLGLLVQRFRQAILYEDDKAIDGLSSTLSNLLLGRLYREGTVPADYRRWIIVPTRVLNGLPFGALKGPDGRFLIEHVSITMCPSGSIWLSLAQKMMFSQTKSFAGLANPILDRNVWDELPQTVIELDTITKLLSGWKHEVQKNAGATIDFVQRSFQGANVVHVGSHGEFPEDDAFHTQALMLTPTDGHDGRLDSAAISQLQLEHCELLTLSICNGGLYRFGAGNEPFGMLRSFLVAGARNILGALWAVEDEACSLFIVSFYKRVLEMSISEAVREACIAFIRDKSAVCNWAGFTLWGPGRIQFE